MFLDRESIEVKELPSEVYRMKVKLIENMKEIDTLKNKIRFKKNSRMHIRMQGDKLLM